LATLTSAEENLWVWETFGHPVLYWLGAVQPPGSPEPAGGWTWVSGEPWSYENWSDGEPNNANGNESATHFFHWAVAGEWNDCNPDTDFPGYIVEYDVLEPHEPTQWPAAEGGNDHFYFAVSAPDGCTWADATGIADASFWNGMQAHLATIGSSDENQWIWDTLGPLQGYRLGGFQLEGSPEPDGGWAWRSGEPWAFDFWSDGEPNNANGDESTLIFIDFAVNGEWNDTNTATLCQGLVLEYEPMASSTKEMSWSAIKALFDPVE
jgi:hypothetical protein